MGGCTSRPKPQQEAVEKEIEEQIQPQTKDNTNLTKQFMDPNKTSLEEPLSIRKQRKIQEVWERAEIHRQASVVGIPIQRDRNKICDCCDQIVERERLTIWEHTKELQIFGFGYPLWFSFLKYCIFLIVVLIASKTSSEIYMATKQNYDFCRGQDHGHHGDGHGISPLQQHLAQHLGYTSKGMHTIVRNGSFLEGPSQNIVLHQQHRLFSSQNQQVQNSIDGIQRLREHNKNTDSPLIKSLNNRKLKSIHKRSSSQKGTGEVHQASDGHQYPVQCTSFMVYFSIFVGQKMYENPFLKIVEFLVHLFFLIYIRNMILKEEQYYDERTTLISDFAIIISNLPMIQGVKKMASTMFEKEFRKTYGKSKSSIKHIIYVFQDEELNKLTQNEKIIEKQLLQSEKQDDEQKQQQIRKRWLKNEDQKDKQAKRIRRQMDRDTIKCDKLIVMFATEHDKAQVLQQYEQNIKKGKSYKQYFDGEGKIKLKEAPEPNELIWKHLSQSDTKRTTLIIRGWIFTFIFLAIVFVVFYFVLLAKTLLFLEALEREHHNPNDPSVKQFKIFSITIVFLAIFGVLMFNKFVMGKVLHYFVHTERHAYTDKESYSFSLKYALGMFFTTALMTLAVEALTFGNFYAHQFGVIQEETIMFMVSAFFIPFVWVINPYNLMKKMKFKRKYKTLVSQKTANELIEPFPYDLGKRYAQVLQIMWFTFLYSDLIPLGSFLTLIGLILYFWIDKYNFLNRSTLKAGLSGKMAIYGLRSLDATLFLSPAGAVLFDFLLRQNFDWFSLIFAVLGIIYLFMPITELIWHFNAQKFLLDQKSYDQAKMMFRTTYFNSQPVYIQTHQKQIKKHKEQVHEYYRKQLQQSKIYGAGRGNYVKDQNRQMTSGTTEKKKGKLF